MSKADVTHQRRMVRPIGSLLADVAAAASDAEAFCASEGVAESQALRIGLALDELVSNALTHGASGKEGPDVIAEIWVDDLLVHLKITADGPAFDPCAPRRSTEKEAVVGGRGLALVLAFADDFVYDRSGTQNIMTFSVSRYPPGEG